MASRSKPTIAEGRGVGPRTSPPPEPEEDVNTAGAEGVGSGSLVTFTLAELQAYTGNFGGEKSGRRSRNLLYKGLIAGRHDPSLDGREIAVKVLIPNDEIRKEEWLREVDHLPKFADHPNIITLLGKCETTRRLFLVFPWMEKGDLQHNMSENKHTAELDWGRALKVLTGTAKALQAMHSQNPPLIHRDLKPANVLLDDSWNPLLCDFGLVGPPLASIFGGTQLHTEAEAMQGCANEGTDMYSFGVLLLQVVMKSPSAIIKPDYHVTEWAQELDYKGTVCEAAHKDLMDTGCNEKMAENIILIGLGCLHTTIPGFGEKIFRTSLRVTTGIALKVLSKLEAETQVQVQQVTRAQETQVQQEQEIGVQQETPVQLETQHEIGALVGSSSNPEEEETVTGLATASSSKKGGLIACFSCFKADAA